MRQFGVCFLLAGSLALFGLRLDLRGEEASGGVVGSSADIKDEINEIKDKLERITGGIQFQGFFDVQAASYRVNPNVFALGDFELDMNKSIGEQFQISAALVFDKDGARMDTGFIDFHLFGGRVASRGRLFTERGFHFQVGRFDVTFGNDWQYFGAPDRITISSPLTTDQVMDGGYNDTGLRILRNSFYYNIGVFALQGIGQGILIGGRLAATPFNSAAAIKNQNVQKLEFGLSVLHDLDQQGRREERDWAIDLECRLDPLQLQAEYIAKRSDIDQIKKSGYHISGFLFLERWARLPLAIFARLDRYKLEPLAGSQRTELVRLSSGFNWNIQNVAILKGEFQHYTKGSGEFYGNVLMLQLVVVF
jgi:hypothetical protein